MSRPKSSKITTSAKGKACTVELHPYCNGEPGTTVHAHAPSPFKGMGLKSPDWWGARACSACHDIVDGRVRVELSSEEVYRCFMRGVFKTIQQLIDEGEIIVTNK